MQSAAPPDLIDELGTLASSLCAAETWLTVSMDRRVPFADLGGAKLPAHFPCPIIRESLAELWSEGPDAARLIGLGTAELQAPPWNVRLVVAMPLRASNGIVAGALCLLNPDDTLLTFELRRALTLVAERMAKAMFLPAQADGSLLPGFGNGHSPGRDRISDLNALLNGIREEDPQHSQAEEEACEHYARMERFEGALLGLVRAGHDDLSTTLRLVTEVAAEALNVGRVEIWLFDEAHVCLRRKNVFPPEAAEGELAVCWDDCPRFFAGIDAQLVIAIANTGEDARAQELMARLPIPDIGALLIVPVWLQGRAVGILAHIHCGTTREWSRDEQDFSGAVAGIVALALEADAHRNTEAQLHALAAHLDAVREEERAALARELHDELGQMLTALRMDAAWLGKACATQPEKLAARGPERVAGMKQLLDEAVATVQRISSDLRPGPLHELGLVAALEWQLAEFQKRSGIITSLVVPEGEFAIGDRIAIALYRALQESLTNVARHAGATEVRVTLRVSPQRISLEVRDNGKGISEHATRNATSLGLIGMRERAAALGGEVVFRGVEGQGTAVLVSLPNAAAAQPEGEA